MVNPTPTQAEIDAAATGLHVYVKENDGSPLDIGVRPPDTTPPLEAEPKAEAKSESEPEQPRGRKKQEATYEPETLPNPGYRTRDFSHER